uniref:Uncharacterized protein n=1 Tax=Rhizophora mucronata TaxID=61149 RepID=A0A2P2NCV5_RHIMU
MPSLSKELGSCRKLTVGSGYWISIIDCTCKKMTILLSAPCAGYSVRERISAS